jgi:signal transduction histidine kinase
MFSLCAYGSLPCNSHSSILVTTGGSPPLLPSKFRQYSNRNLFIALGAIIIVALVATVATLVALSALVAVRQTAKVNNSARYDLQNLGLKLRIAESSDRGYFITGDPDYLARYHAATDQVRTSLKNLNEEAKNSAYYDDVNVLKPLVQDKLANMDQNVQLFQQGGPGEPQLVQNFERGKANMDKISSTTDAIMTDQTAQLAKDQQSVSGLASAARDISLGTLAVTLVLAGTINYLYIKAIQAEHELDRAKDEFVSLASHQLRTPATGVKSILSTLAAGDFGSLPDRQAYFVNKALECNERELAVIEELLNVAKAEAGRLVLNPSQVDVGALVETVVSEQRHTIEGKGISLVVKRPSKPVFIEADQEKLYMALSNLLDNARKYTPDSGRITIKVFSRPGGAAVEVADNGIGIDPSDIGQIFDRFGRANTALAGNVDGAGLGLYLTHRITELHQGTIEVDSQKGHGSRFTVTLPVGRA